jgi:hypothetical protein
MPDKPPHNTHFLQKEMLKTYNLAYKEANPRFVSVAKRGDKNNRVPYNINKDKWQDEKKVKPSSAWSNSIFTVKLWWWKKSYEAHNVRFTLQ